MCLMGEGGGEGGTCNGFNQEVAKRVATVFLFIAPPKCLDDWMYVDRMSSRMLSVLKQCVKEEGGFVIERDYHLQNHLCVL